MTPYKAYKYCPRCCGNLKHTTNNLIQCQTCGYHLFINAAPCVGIIIENTEDRVMLAKRAIAPLKGTWDIPGGFMEPGETAYLNAIREAKEELNVRIRPGMIIGTWPATYLYKEVDLPILGITICAKIIEGTITAQDDVAQIQYFSEEELQDIHVMNEGVKSAYTEYFKLRKRVPLKTLLNE
ncbi:MAG: NUDIX domain-containing protein [bacterium]|nr:NUDIX domain-containing protein [bacterium]